MKREREKERESFSEDSGGFTGAFLQDFKVEGHT